MNRAFVRRVRAVAALLAAGCSTAPAPATPDAAPPSASPDAAPPPTPADAASARPGDASADATADARTPSGDATPPSADARPTPPDAALAPPDGAVERPDAEDRPADAGPTPDAARPLPPLPRGYTALAPLPGGARQEVAVAAVDHELFVVGGLDHQERLLTRVEVFDTRSRTWRAGVDLPVPVSHANLAAVDGTLYLLGFLGRRFVPDGRGFVLPPGADHWSPGPSLPPGRVRGGAGMVVAGGRVFVLGGFAVRAVPFVDVLDVGTGTWTPLPDLPVGRDHAAAARISGEVFVTAGTSGTPEEVLSTSWGLDEPAGTWRARGPLGVARGAGAAAALADRLYVFGGEGLGPGAAPGGVYDVVEVYEPALDAFAPLDPLPRPLRGLGAAAVPPAIYLFGGATALGTAPVETTWAFVP